MTSDVGCTDAMMTRVASLRCCCVRKDMATCWLVNAVIETPLRVEDAQRVVSSAENVMCVPAT